jgi:hypothetical protein
LKPLLIAFTAGALLLLGIASPAAAKPPCWRVLINDWYDGRIDGTYPASCYRQAIANAPEDIKTYSSLQEDLTRALQATTRGAVPAGARGRHGAPDDPVVTGDQTTTTTTTTASGKKEVVVVPVGKGKGPNGTPPPPSAGLFTKGLNSIGPKNATSVPLPLIILAAIALLLLAAGAAGFVARRVQTRRQGGIDGPTDPAGQSS